MPYEVNFTLMLGLKDDYDLKKIIDVLDKDIKTAINKIPEIESHGFFMDKFPRKIKDQ